MGGEDGTKSRCLDDDDDEGDGEGYDFYGAELFIELQRWGEYRSM